MYDAGAVAEAESRRVQMDEHLESIRMEPATVHSLLVRRAAVLGAGTMGSRIAAHLANAGIPVLLLDLGAKGSDSVQGDPVQRDLSN